MRIVEILLPCSCFYNPANGEAIAFAYGLINEESKSLKGWWNHEILFDPSMFDQEFSIDWQTALYNYEMAFEEAESKGMDFEMDYPEMLEKFLMEYEREDWMAFKVDTTEFGCGPLQMTDWYVLDLSQIE